MFDYKCIGIMYLIGVMVVFVVGGLIVLIFCVEFFMLGQMFFLEQFYNWLFMLYGVIMVFVFIIFSVLVVFGNFVLLIMFGVKDVVFLCMNLVSFYFWVLGILFFFVVIVVGNFDMGWIFYMLYSIMINIQVVVVVMGVFIFGFSLIFMGLNFIVIVNMMWFLGMMWF